jgi:hypothetical protein
MVRLGTVALDDTKVAANAAERANRTHDKLEAEVAEILRQAAEADQREDRQHSDGCGDELPEALASKATGSNGCGSPRRLEAEAAARQQRYRQRVVESTARGRPDGSASSTRRPERGTDGVAWPRALSSCATRRSILACLASSTAWPVGSLVLLKRDRVRLSPRLPGPQSLRQDQPTQPELPHLPGSHARPGEVLVATAT